MKKISLILLLFPYYLNAQENSKGISFIQNKYEWKDVIKLAKKENKYIFVDAYATWCLPCKKMESRIFSIDSIGDFFNNRFINVRIQLDSTTLDSKEIRNWYSTAKSFSLKYEISSLPTYLFFNSKGEILEKETGAFFGNGEFLKKAKEALEPSRQFYTLLKKFTHKNISIDELKILLQESLEKKEKEIICLVGNKFLSTTKDPFNKDNLLLIGRASQIINSKSFDFYKENITQINSVLGENKAELILENALFREMYYKYVVNNKIDDLTWRIIGDTLISIYPVLSDKILLRLKKHAFYEKEDWPSFERNVILFYSNYFPKDPGGKMNMNNELFEIFLHSNDTLMLKQAASLSKQIFKLGDDDIESASVIDTYANLIYKLGDVQEAIKWEELSLTRSKEQKSKGGIENATNVLDKMRKGLPTWSVN